MKTKLLLAVAFFGIFVLVSCKKDNKTVPVQILLTDNPDTYTAVNIHIKEIKVKINNDDTGWIHIDSKDTTINLLDLQNGITSVIAQDNLPEGVLQEVRFILGDDNTIVDNGVTYPLQTPSAEDSGLKIKINKQL